MVKFRILHQKGIVQFSASASPYKWKTIKSDSVYFTPNYYIKLAKNTELTLVSSSNNYYQLNKEGIYKLGNLKTPVNNSLLSSYIKYLWSSFLHKDHVDLEKERLEYIQTVGGVSRGTTCLLFLPASGYVTSDSIVFSWSNPGLDKQSFEIYADLVGSNRLYKKELSDSLYILKSTEFNFIKGNSYYWKIKDSDEFIGCNMKSFIVATDDETKFMLSKSDELNASLTFSEGINYLMKAYFFAENAWNNNAVECYKKAAKAAPGNPAIIAAKEYFNKIEIE